MQQQTRQDLDRGVIMKRNFGACSRREFVKLGSAGLLLSVAGGRSAFAARSSAGHVVIDDPQGVLGRTQAPVTGSLLLPERFRKAAAENRLVFRERASRSGDIRAQILNAPAGEAARYCFFMPAGPPGSRSFEPAEMRRHESPSMQAGPQPNGPQFILSEQTRPVLQYNYSKIEPGQAWSSITAENRKYAVARSDYIHPLYGLEGEVLTKDWSPEHPHHRGIYWAWPEVDWHGRRGDLHALQNVFARPAGQCELLSGPVFAQINAENTWHWETGEPIVRERAAIRAYRATPAGRLVDLEFQFEAVADPVQIARRGTSHYGGLNLRLTAVKDQRIIKHTDPPGSGSRAAWSDLSGVFPGSEGSAGLAVLQHNSNPDYPGDWIDYPELNWVQPAFPASGTRYEIRKASTLRLKFRLWIHPGSPAMESAALDQWRAAHHPHSPLLR